jgi:hypothetical protein
MDVCTQYPKQAETVFREQSENHIDTRPRRIDDDGDAFVRITQQVTNQPCVTTFDRLEMHDMVLPNDSKDGRRLKFVLSVRGSLLAQTR